MYLCIVSRVSSNIVVDFHFSASHSLLLALFMAAVASTETKSIHNYTCVPIRLNAMICERTAQDCMFRMCAPVSFYSLKSLSLSSYFILHTYTTRLFYLYIGHFVQYSYMVARLYFHWIDRVVYSESKKKIKTHILTYTQSRIHYLTASITIHSHRGLVHVCSGIWIKRKKNNNAIQSQNYLWISA